MKICNIKCNNHARVADLDVDVGRHLVLVGPNAAGKTTILRMLDLALHGTVAQLWNRLSASDLRLAAEAMTFSVTFDNLTDSDRAAFPDEVWVQPLADGSSTSTLTIELRVTADQDEVEIERAVAKGSARMHISRSQLDHLGWELLTADRSPERELGVGQRSALRRLVLTTQLGDDVDAVTRLLGDATAALDGSAGAIEMRETVAEKLSQLLPAELSSGDLVLKIAGGLTDDPLEKAELHRKQSNTQSTQLYDQSDGLRALTTVAIQQLVSGAELLAIDEPETHLHPRSQARLAATLAQSAGQKVVATHSSSVLAEFSPADVVVVLPGGTRQLGGGPSAPSAKFFGTWWDDGSLEPLTANGILLVEGPSDKLLVRRVASLLGMDLDRLGISIVTANGAAGFKPLLRLFGPAGFDVPATILVDQEESTIVATALGVGSSASELEEAHVYISDPDLEGECVESLGVERHLALLVASGHFQMQKVMGAVLHADPQGRTAADLDAAAYTVHCRSEKILVAHALASVMEAEDALRFTRLRRIIEALVA